MWYWPTSRCAPLPPSSARLLAPSGSLLLLLLAPHLPALGWLLPRTLRLLPLLVGRRVEACLRHPTESPCCCPPAAPAIPAAPAVLQPPAYTLLSHYPAHILLPPAYALLPPAALRAHILPTQVEAGIVNANWRIRQSSVELLGDLLFKVQAHCVTLHYISAFACAYVCVLLCVWVCVHARECWSSTF